MLGQQLLGARQSTELEAGAISLYCVHEPAPPGCSFPLPPTQCKLWLVFLTVLPALTTPLPPFPLCQLWQLRVSWVRTPSPGTRRAIWSRAPSEALSCLRAVLKPLNYSLDY